MPTRGSEEWWKDYLTHGHRLEGMARWLFPRLPASPRCKVCSAPFQGFGRLLRPFGWSPSSKNPNICGFCSNRLPAGGAEVPVAVFVVDVRDYSGLSARTPPLELAATMSAFFDLVTRVLLDHDALIDKYMGDGLQALFLEGVAGKGFGEKALAAALAARRALAQSNPPLRDLPVGIAVHSGVGFVGNVGAVGMVDLTAMGDVVNVANRLQGQAGGGEIILGGAYLESPPPEGFERASFELKGQPEPVPAYILKNR